MIHSEPQTEICPSCLPHKTSDEAEPDWIRLLNVIVFALVLLSIGITSAYRPMWADEFFSLYTDKVASIGDLLHIQSSYPVSLDPPGFHLLAHFAISLFGANAIAVRLPSVIGFALMMACVYAFVRRIYGIRAGILAMAMLMSMHSLYYASEARPYGLLLGFSAAALTAWQGSIRQSNRRIPLMCLAAAVFACLECHYFALLIPAALVLLECIRTVRNKKFDFPVILSVLVGSSAVLTWLPFLHAAGQYRTHYFTSIAWSALSIGHQILNAYGIMLNHKSRADMLIIAVLVIVVAVGLRSTIRDWRKQPTKRLEDEDLAFIVLAALPIGGVFLALLTCGAFESRFTIEATIGISGIAAGLLRCVIRRDLVFICLVTVLVGYPVFQSVHQASSNINYLRSLQTLALPSSISDSQAKILVSDLHKFLKLTYYVSPNLAKHLWYAEDKEQGLPWMITDDRSAEYLRKFTNLQILSYNSIQTCGVPQIIWVDQEPSSSWLLRERIAEHFQMTTVRVLEGGVLELASPNKTTECQKPVQNQ